MGNRVFGGPAPRALAHRLCLAAIVLLGTTLGLRSMAPPKIDFGDGLDYLAAAYHLRHHRTFTQAGTDAPAPPGLGREPGYPAVLSMLMLLDPDGVGAYRPSCAPPDPACDPRRYRAVALLNLAVIEASGVLLFVVARRLTGDGGAGLAAAGYLLLDTTLMRSHWYDPMSDPLALLLVAASLLTLSSARSRGNALAWAGMGLVAACATLVKAAFLPFCLAGAGVGALAVLRDRNRRTEGLRALVAAVAVYAVLVGGWVARNAAVSGMVRLTDNRGGIALSTREVFDHLTPAQFAAAFVYWTPDFGERLAHRLFAPDTIARFDLYAPGGFYDEGQNGYGRRVAALAQSEALDAWTAAARVDREIVGDIARAPFGYAVSTLPLLYRGVWVDQFGIAGLALLVWSAGIGLRRRDGLLLAIAGFGLYNELFYALVSLNIPRYQITALPAIAVAAGVAVVEVGSRLRGKRRAGIMRPLPGNSSAGLPERTA